MSVATQLFAPDYDDQFDVRFDNRLDDAVPRRAHLRAVPAEAPGAPVVPPARRASVAVLVAPEPERVPMRLTRRGVIAVAVLVAALGGLLIWVAALSAPSDAAPGGAVPAGGAAAVVTVQSGDTLWSIASRVAPTVDPRAEVEHLRQLNDLDGVALVPGQQLHVR